MSVKMNVSLGLLKTKLKLLWDSELIIMSYHMYFFMVEYRQKICIKFCNQLCMNLMLELKEVYIKSKVFIIAHRTVMLTRVSPLSIWCNKILLINK